MIYIHEQLHQLFAMATVVSYFGCFQPFVVGNVPAFVQYHPPIFDFPKQTRPILAAQGDKIQACLRIIVSLKTDATAMVFLRFIGHYTLFSSIAISSTV